MTQQWDHRMKLDEIRRHFGWTHLEDCTYFERWLTAFLVNKGGDVPDAIAKLERRLDVEEKELWSHKIIESMRTNLSAGTIRDIGEDLDGSTVLYCVTRRDFPTSANRDDRKKNFDMLIGYGTRLRPGAKNSGGLTMLVDHLNAGVWANTDLSYVSSVAVRLSKYWPGGLHRVVITRMGRALAAVLKPLISAMPAHIGSKIVIVSESEIEEGRLLDYFAPEVIPHELGGLNNTDTPDQWVLFADHLYSYYGDCVRTFEAFKTSGRRFPDDKMCMMRLECEQWLASTAPPELNVFSTTTPGSPSRSRHHRSASQLSPRNRLKSITEAAGSPGGRDMNFYDCMGVEQSSVMFNTPADCRVIIPMEEESPEDLWTALGRGAHEGESHCRGTLQEYEEERRRDLSELMAATAELCGVHVTDTAAPDRLVSRCPDATRAVGRVALWVCCTLVAAYFTAATMFLLLFVLVMMMVAFLGMFHSTAQTFPCLFAVLVLGHQGALIATRGIECIHGAFQGRPVMRFRACGKMKFRSEGFGCYVQTGVWALVLVVTALIFFVYMEDVNGDSGGQVLDSGIKIAFAWGWLGCAAALAFFHFVFPTPLVEEGLPSSHVPQVGIGILSIYLLLDVSEAVEASDRSNTDAEHRETWFRMVGIALFLFTSVALGVAHMITGDVILLIFACIVTTFSALFANYILGSQRSMRSDLSRHLVLTFGWILAISWIYIMPGIGAFGLGMGGATTMLSIASVVFMYFLLILGVGAAKGSHLWRVQLLRVAYAFLSGMVVTALGYAFVVNWGFGVLMVVLFLHCCLCYTLRHGTQHAGIGLLVLGFIILSIVVVLLGYELRAKEHSAPQSLREYVGSGLTSYPMCSRGHGTAQLTITDFSFFCNLAHATPNSEALTKDLKLWFPSFRLESEVAFGDRALIRMFYSDTLNTTVFAIRGSTSLPYAMQSTSTWVEAIAFTPLGLILPLNWTTNLVYSTSFLDRLLQFPTVHEEVTAWLSNALSSHRENDTTNVYVTGYGYGGWLAQVAGSQLGIMTFAYASPGVQYSRMKYNLAWYRVLQHVVNIIPLNSAMADIDSHTGAVQPITCQSTKTDVSSCQTLMSVTCEILRSCGSAGNRSFAAC